MKLRFEGELPVSVMAALIHDPGNGRCQIDGKTPDYRPIDSEDATHEMLASEFVGIWNRLCKSYNTSPCEECPVHEWCTSPPRVAEYKEMETALVEWAKAHPEKKRKTYAEDFKEHFGYTWGEAYSSPQCRYELYDKKECDRTENTHPGSCAACWNEEMEDEE